MGLAARAGAIPLPMRCPLDLDEEAERGPHEVLLGVVERIKAHGLAE